MQKAAWCTCLALGLAVATTSVPAASADLAGSWKGGGTVKFSSGATEQAHCRATFSPSGKTAYDVSATCATSSGTVSQTAHVRGSGSSYRGTFYNPEFDATGKITIAVSGRSQVVRLNSTKGSAVIRLSR
ncbi:MAG: hypothetical protein K2Y42_07230 [Hyphomicrobium sp.]|jgi:hypothetical protein|uniref:hypothetical protein n=1 Tax=Hyphomicrobium sp. TaxID=82 RepID=UPI0025B7EA13|nr:hypothetical protein [Hyphomicrobium sp.]MBX9862531.1 hypothetical protein [Hyphomicrobium sp.]